ncbi:MAG TPA: hypothetical protein VGN75_13625 [Kaistia sp.]|jgi:hypothetical protein|nr:hypothetical protein [Kaistia sp.]
MLAVNQLNGFGVGGDEPFSLTYINESQSTTATISIPTGAVPGDLAILFQMGTTATAATPLVTPSGWTRAYGVNGLLSFIGRGGSFEYKVLTSGDISAGTVTGINGNSNNQKAILLLRPSKPIATISTVSTAGVFTSSDPPSQTITPTGLVAVLYGIAAGATAGTAVVIGSMAANLPMGAVRATGGFVIENDALASETWDMADLGDVNLLLSCSIQVAP